MSKTLKIAHLLGLALFLGSIPGHIVLGRMADPALDPSAFAAFMQAKYVNVLALTLPGLGLTLVTGAALMRRWCAGCDRRRWLAVKLALVALIALNGAVVLRPLARDIATVSQEAVATGTMPPAYAALARRETAFGAVNLIMILAVIALAVAKPALSRSAGARGAGTRS